MAHGLLSCLKGSNSSKEAEQRGLGHSSAVKGNSRVKSSHTQVNPLASFPSSFPLLLKRLRWEFPAPCYSSPHASIFLYLVNVQLFAPELYHKICSPTKPVVLCYQACQETLQVTNNLLLPGPERKYFFLKAALFPWVGMSWEEEVCMRAPGTAEFCCQHHRWEAWANQLYIRCILI